jgi:CHAT domain-containing protein
VIDAFRTALQPDAARGDVRVWALADGSFSASAQRPDGAATPVDDAAPIGAWLTRHLLAPLDATLSKYKRWILALDAGIAHLPFDALPWQERPLGQHVALTITQSLSVFVQGRKLRATPVPSPAATRWLGFGAPDYTELNAGLSQGRNSSPAQLALRAPQRDAGLRNRFAPLPHALSELKSVAALFTGSKLYVGIDATERRLRDMSNSGELARFDILHFAAHATVHPQRASLSALVLGATGVAPEHDGLVTAAEWTELRVASDLVVLSACETALGPRVSGEGVLGLPYALFVAGNRNALLTLWPVADDATARFMRAFFARLVRGESAPDSLAATKRDFASGKFGIREQAPFYWAPFILVGPG